MKIKEEQVPAIVVTGGAGFIGSHLVAKLLSLGERVIVVDNLITTGDLRYLKSHVDNPNLSFFNADIRDLSRLVSIFLGTSISKIYNLASPASVGLYTKNPILTFETSTVGVSNMIQIGMMCGIDNWGFLETSTSEVYGDPEVHPQPETYLGNVSTQCERSCYDEGKRSAETICYMYHEKLGLNTHIARIFNTYGPNNTDDRVMPTFLANAMNKKSLPIFGDGSQSRSFCYVDDTVDGLIRLMESDYHSPINIGNGSELTMLELAKIINELVGNTEPHVYLPLPDRDPKVRRPDIKLAKEILNWEPKVDILTGINKVKLWMESQD